MTALIDFHSHNKKNQKHKYLLIKDLGVTDDSNHFVAGAHPWDTTSSICEDIFKKHIDDPFFLGIGEIGLDKLRPHFDLQLNRFEQQVKIAVKLKIQFLVIHDIKSSQEILKILKESKYDGLINLHGFNNSLENFKQYSSHFKTFVSFGEQYLKSPKLQNVIKNISLDNIFFETDDSNIDLSSVYDLYALQNNITIKDLTELLGNNFTKLIKTIKIQH